jgi:glycosyltransferase involved in cell wall biosynthesis
MLHVLHIIANNSSVPYLGWFAARAHKEQSVRFSFIAMHSQRPAMIDEMKAYGFDVFWIPFDQSKRMPSMIKVLPKLFSLIRRIRPDVVQTHLFDDTFPAMIAARLLRVPVRAITKQDTAFHWYFAPKGVKYDRWNNRNATHLIAVSEEAKEFIIEKEKADPDKVRVIHHGIPTDLLTAQTEERKEKLRTKYKLHDKIVIGTVARLIEWKGYRHIIAAAKNIVAEFPDARFLFCGQGDQQPELEKLIREARLEQQIIFAGWVERDDIPSLYGIMDIYLHAAFMEPFGFVIAEAMMNGTAVVSTATGAARDGIRDGENGFLVAQPDPQLLAAAVLRALHLSADERKAIGLRGKETALRMYSFDTMWEGHLRLYREATGNNQ